VTKQTFGILVGAIASAASAWWWVQQRRMHAERHLTPARERGTVIFDNTPTVAPEVGASA
jgi:hypothetical protein